MKIPRRTKKRLIDYAANTNCVRSLEDVYDYVERFMRLCTTETSHGANLLKIGKLLLTEVHPLIVVPIFTDRSPANSNVDPIMLGHRMSEFIGECDLSAEVISELFPKSFFRILFLFEDCFDMKGREIMNIKNSGYDHSNTLNLDSIETHSAILFGKRKKIEGKGFDNRAFICIDDPLRFFPV